MKKICFAFNHLQYSDGVARSVIGISNYLVQHYDVDVTLRPIYLYRKEVFSIIDNRIHVSPVFGFYFQGMAKLVSRLPKAFLHNLIYGKRQYDIEVGFQNGTSTMAVTYGSSKSETRHLIWMHGYDEGLTMLPYFKRADTVVCVSKFNADRLFKESNGTVVPEYSYNLIDEKKVIKDGEEGIDIDAGEKTIFVSVARHSEEKGYKRLIQCVDRLKRDGYEFELWLVGDGPEHQELVNLSEKLELGDYIRFIGAQSNPHKYTSKSDLFVCSSFSEGYSTACTEAIMLGIPVLSTNVSGAEEIIKEAEAGMVVENTDEALYQGLKTVLENKEIMTAWKKTIQTTKSRFSLEQRAEKLVRILELNA